MPKITVLSPCDATQAQKAIIAAVEQANGPVYLRFGREAVPDFTPADFPFQIGKAQLLNQGNDLTIIATGHLTWEALQAAYKLKEIGIAARVLNIHTIKPIDKEAIVSSAKETQGIITAEEHQISGGLGSAVAEVLAQNYPVPVEFIGMKDTFGESGKPEELMEKYEMTSDYIVKAAIRLSKRIRN